MKKSFYIIGLLFGLLLLCSSVKAQAPFERSSKITKIGNKEYYMHFVKEGQTIEQIEEVYQVTRKEIYQFNPDVENGLKVGFVIGIPVRPPKAVEPEPVAEEPEPIVEEPEVVIEEPAPEPEPELVVEIPEPEPEPEPLAEEPVTEIVVVEPDPEPEPDSVVEEPDPKVVKVGGRYSVQENEDLYDIAKKFGIDIADFKAINPGLDNEPFAGSWIHVPNIINENDYIVHRVEKNERTSSLLKRWKVDEREFRAMNVTVGSHVFANQTVLIPIERIRPESEATEMPDDESEESLFSEEPEFVEIPDDIFNEPMETPECYADPDNALRRYQVVLMIPLYLDDVSGLEVTKSNLPTLQKSRTFSFLPFYEGFRMAVERLTEEEGLILDLTVIDVTENVNTAQQALDKIRHQRVDMIIGPFFSKSFSMVADYAREKGILLVNPLSTRHEVVEGNGNVIKLKPARDGWVLDIACLMRNRYPDANVFILSSEKVGDSLFLAQLEHNLNIAVKDEVTVTGNEFLQYARDESQRLEMGARMVSTITVEGQVYSTNELKNGSIDHVTFANPVHRYVYNTEDLRMLTSQLSGVRDNVIVAYGDDNVFATQVLNTLKKEADRYPITLICASDWTRFEKLLVENLLQMNAIYLTDNFVDYRSEEVNRFVIDFRERYSVEPQDYAFAGYDVASYFLTALMRYGVEMMECLPYFTMPLFHTRYHFMRKGLEDGMENQSWMMYQYDKEQIELVPINPFKKVSE